MCAYGDSLYAFFCYRRYRTIKPNNSKDLPINEEINAPEVRVIGPDNEQVGVMKIDDARTYAYNNGVDLVLIVPNATPPFAVLSITVNSVSSVTRERRKLRKSR